MKRLIGKFSFVVWMVMVSVGATNSAWARDFERMFIFGDSLSDPGNMYEFTGKTSQPPYALVPEFPYDFDGFHYSDGKTWAQWLARHLEMKRSGQAALVAPGVNGNYAFGRARAGSTAPAGTVPASEQLLRYLNDHGGTADANALYVVQFGANDVRDALFTLLSTGNFEAAQAVIENAVTTELGIIKHLADLGAEQFLVVNVPNISVAPATIMGGPQAEFFATLFTNGYNTGLEQGLQVLETALGISIRRFNLYSVSTTMQADPKAFGIQNAETPCLLFIPGEKLLCDRPNKYFFLDGIHPTAKVHKLISEEALRILE